MERKVIWSNINLDLDDWKDDLVEQFPEATEDELYYIMVEENAEYLQDERMNLDIQLSQEILVIADLGLWNGSHTGYRIIKSGNIKDCLYSNTDYTEWYVDTLGDLRADAIHHDGTNHYLYRVFKDSASETQRENLLNKIYNGCVTRTDITRLTRRLGDDIGNVYGWEFSKHKSAA